MLQAALDGSHRVIETGHDPVARVLHFASAFVLQGTSNKSIMSPDHLDGSCIPEPCSHRSRIHDVGEHDRSEGRIDHHALTCACWYGVRNAPQERLNR